MQTPQMSSNKQDTIKSKISESRLFAFLTIFAVIGAIGHHLYVLRYLSLEYFEKFKSLNFSGFANIGLNFQKSWVPGGIIVCKIHHFF